MRYRYLVGLVSILFVFNELFFVEQTRSDAQCHFDPKNSRERA